MAILSPDILPLLLLSPTLLLLSLGLVWFVLRHQRMLHTKEREVARVQDMAQHQALAAALVAQEDERQRIAGALHDGVGTILALAKLHLFAQGGNPSLEAAQLIDQAVSEVRRISRNLQPATLQQLGLEQALYALVQAVPSGPAPEVHLEQSGFRGRLIPAHELMVYRIAQELLANGIRHSQAQRISLRVALDKNTLTLEYTDNGRGFDPRELDELPPPGPNGQSVGMGLINLRSRVTVLGGRLSYHSQPGAGTRVEAVLPIITLADARVTTPS